MKWYISILLIGFTLTIAGCSTALASSSLPTRNGQRNSDGAVTPRQLFGRRRQDRRSGHWMSNPFHRSMDDSNSIDSCNTTISFSELVAVERQLAQTTNHDDQPDSVAIRLLCYTLQAMRFGLSLITFVIGVGVGVTILFFAAISKVVFSTISAHKGPESPRTGTVQQESTTLQMSTQQDVDATTSSKSIQSDSNISVKMDGGGSRTALLALYGRLQGHFMLNGPDTMASTFLQKAAETNLSLRLLSICGRLTQLNYQLTGSIFDDQIAYIFTLTKTALIAPLHCRTCWLDDCVEAFVRSVLNSKDGPSSNTNRDDGGNLILLGSGWDSRFYRLGPRLREARIHCYEVDAPGTLQAKRRVLEKVVDSSTASTGKTTKVINEQDFNIQYCSCNFETQNWLQVLQEDETISNFDPSLPTFIVWEGVTMYLSKETIIKTLETIANVMSKTTKRGGKKPTWYIAFDYINAQWAMSRPWKWGMSKLREPFQFAVSDVNEINGLVEKSGLSVFEHLTDPTDLAHRYVPKSKRNVIIGNYGGFVVAGPSQT